MRWTITPWLLPLALAACGPQVGLDALAAGASGRVVEAASGDALVLAGGAQVRLAGVEAPHGEEPYAAEARATLSRLTLGREVQLLHGGAPQDPLGRTVAQMREARTRRWIEGELQRAGAVRVRTYADNRAMARDMLIEEARARIARRGLWARPDYRVRLPGEVGSGERGLVVVEGRIAAAVRDGGRMRLAFAEAPGGLVAEIPRGAWDDFAVAGLGIETLPHRLLRLRGTVRTNGGRPILWLDHPEQVEPLKGG